LKPSINQIDANNDMQAQILLKEYELCLIDANHLEDTIWTVTGILITASVAGIGFLGSSLPKYTYDLLVRLGVAILSLIIIYAWNRIVMRLYSIQQVLYYRTREIEEELNMYRNRYITYLGSPSSTSAPPQNLRFSLLRTNIGNRFKGRTVRGSIPFIRWSLIISWILFGALQIVAFFHLV
jgi:hypothetical protein